MTENILKTGDRQIVDVLSINRQLTEKALRMRCLGYYSNVKANLLTQTIYEVDSSKKRLESAITETARQHKVISLQNRKLEQSNSALEMIKSGLEDKVKERTLSLQKINEKLQKEVDERTQREETLRQYEYIVSSSSDMLALVDNNFVYMAANSVYSNTFNKSIDDLIGKKASEIFGTQFFESVIKPHAVRCLAGEHVCFTGWYDFSAKEKRHMEINYYPYRGVNNKVEGFVVNGRDITDKTVAEEELTQHRLHLERLVAERTTELEVLNKELESFSYSVSHDLRAPLRIINGFTQAVLDDYADKFDDTGKKYLNYIHDNTLQMNLLIDDLLKLSRVSRKVMAKESVDITAIAEDIASELKESYPERIVEFVLPERLIVENADSGLLKIVMSNFLGNAWKFTKNRKDAKIEFGIEKKDGERVYYVRDNGVGFDMKYKEKLFVAFQRLHSVKDFKGTGVGLVTVQRIIRRHGGRVWADGEVGKGATFYFTL